MRNGEQGDETPRTSAPRSRRLADAAPALAHLLKRPEIVSPARFEASEIRVETCLVSMRDGIRLATDIWLPPDVPAPAIAVRTPYDRANDAFAGAFLSFARRGYVCVSQDCRGTGGSEPETWDYYVREPEDGYDLVEWIAGQPWFDGFLGACGASYAGQTQWQMAMHPATTTFVPDVSGLGVAVNTAHLHMFVNAYARSVGKGEDKLDVPFTELEGEMYDETLATGLFDEPLDKPLPATVLDRFPDIRTLDRSAAGERLWSHYCSLDCAGRAQLIKELTGAAAITIVEMEWLSDVFGRRISHDRHTLPHVDLEQLAESLEAFPMLRTGWYDWGLNDALATWDLLTTSAREEVRANCRLFVAPSAHNMPGYYEGIIEHPELRHSYEVPTNVEVLLQWYDHVRRGAVADWPTVVYYLMGANEWRVADAWPPPELAVVPFYLRSEGVLTAEEPRGDEAPDRYAYDPERPTPTVGGSIVSYVFPPGSVDVAEVQARPDVLTYTTAPLERDVDVVGPLRLVLYASSSAPDTDFAGRLSDVFPDGRAVQLQNGLLRARHRELDGEPQLLEPEQVYRFEIDMWATANRFKAGHRIRLDVSSADFPRFDRNANRGGDGGDPAIALQTIYHDGQHRSHLLLPVLS